MSTLRVDERALEDVVEPFASVAGLRIRPDFPHDLRIEVIEHEPVATVKTGGSSVPATGGGLLLDGVRAGDLPLGHDQGAARRPPRERRAHARGAQGRGRRAAASCAPAPSGCSTVRPA